VEIAIPSIAGKPLLSAIARQPLESWCQSVNKFLQWQYKEVISKKPSPEILDEHRETLKLLLRATLRLHAEVADPDYPLRQFLPEVSGKLHQLEHSWRMIHQPMQDEEADAILQKVFPDAPRARSAA